LGRGQAFDEGGAAVFVEFTKYVIKHQHRLLAKNGGHRAVTG
jgi:hypothetical protein